MSDFVEKAKDAVGDVVDKAKDSDALKKVEDTVEEQAAKGGTLGQPPTRRTTSSTRSKGPMTEQSDTPNRR